MSARSIDMRMMHWLLTLAVAAGVPSTAAAADNLDNGVRKLRVATDAGTVDGTCVLVHRVDRGAEAVLYFLTSSHLFRAAADKAPPSLESISVFLDEARAVGVRREDLFVPPGSLVDVALFRVTTSASLFVPRPLVYDAPSVGDVFLISGFDHSGAPVSVAERVRFESTLLAVGDREVSALSGCIGAPAIGPGGVFGIVSECGAGRTPVVALLSMARPFIERYMPNAPRVSLAPQFRLLQRDIAGPLLVVACDATKAGEVEVPLDLGPREWAIDATAAFANPREIRLGDVSVLRLENRAVWLRFSLGGLPRAPSAPVPCPQGQALVSVHINVARTP